MAALFAADASRAPDRQVSAEAIVRGIGFYQRHVSDALGRAGVRCRFVPTCSHYAAAVVREYGAVRGGWLAVTRIGRCGPWTPMGTVDPPPASGGGRVAGRAAEDDARLVVDHHPQRVNAERGAERK